MTNRKQKEKKRPVEDHLPARSKQSTALLDAPKEGLKLAVERSARVYFSTCRKIARFLNGNG